MKKMEDKKKLLDDLLNADSVAKTYEAMKKLEQHPQVDKNKLLTIMGVLGIRPIADIMGGIPEDTKRDLEKAMNKAIKEF